MFMNSLLSQDKVSLHLHKLLLFFVSQMQMNFILAGNGSHKPVVAIKKSMAYKHAAERVSSQLHSFKL